MSIGDKKVSCRVLMYLLPELFILKCQILNSLLRVFPGGRYLWGNSEEEHHYHLVNWSYVCTPMEDCDCGERKFRHGSTPMDWKIRSVFALCCCGVLEIIKEVDDFMKNRSYKAVDWDRVRHVYSDWEIDDFATLWPWSAPLSWVLGVTILWQIWLETWRVICDILRRRILVYQKGYWSSKLCYCFGVNCGRSMRNAVSKFYIVFSVRVGMRSESVFRRTVSQSVTIQTFSLQHGEGLFMKTMLPIPQIGIITGKVFGFSWSWRSSSNIPGEKCTFAILSFWNVDMEALKNTNMNKLEDLKIKLVKFSWAILHSVRPFDILPTTPKFQGKMFGFINNDHLPLSSTSYSSSESLKSTCSSSPDSASITSTPSKPYTVVPPSLPSYVEDIVVMLDL
ncbi:hypothetical protein IFM89_031045 [Coptis chinensis]|uniref:Uncharacterized protein n=1 Tax=Coptis chinensis TaxID=261450 RepID=A0A835LGA3_9MAGN|nr:hypothetical protein IFM89_031045 [Coptis chinensis]